jgi:hypothetical protein
MAYSFWKKVLLVFVFCLNVAVAVIVLEVFCTAQALPANPAPSDKQINVNWLYGAYVPKTVQLRPLTGDERLKLYVRQTYMTPGIYIKTTLFAVHDQITNSNPEWGEGFDGFAKRLGDRQIQFIVQNSVISAGDFALGWEPRYDRCRCTRFSLRTRHAIVRTFVTYDRTEQSLRPQVMPYLGTFSGAVLATTWQPGHPSWQVRGYQAAITQVFVGAGINWLGEFAPEIVRGVRKKKSQQAPVR